MVGRMAMLVWHESIAYEAVCFDTVMNLVGEDLIR